MHVLLVEDDPSLREGLAELISELSEVRAASTVPEALALLVEQPFDLVVADLRIGGDRDGGKKIVETARRQLVPVVVMSALTLTEIRSQLDRTPPDDVLCKPFQVEDVLDLVGRFVRRKGELELWARRRAESHQLSFTDVEPGLQVAVAERTAEREVCWFKIAPDFSLNRIATNRALALVVEGDLSGGGVRRVPGQSLQAVAGCPVELRSESGSLGVAVFYPACS